MHEVDVDVEVAMVGFVDDFALDDSLQLREIDDVACTSRRSSPSPTRASSV